MRKCVNRTMIYDLVTLFWLDNPEEPQNNYKLLKKIVQNLPSNQTNFVYIRDNHIIRIITLLVKQNINTLCHGLIEDLKVLPMYHNNISEKLLKHVEEVALKKNCSHLFLNCMNSSIKQFHNLGFKKSQHPINLCKTIKNNPNTSCSF